jgi:hypothetical protein
VTGKFQDMWLKLGAWRKRRLWWWRRRWELLVVIVVVVRGGEFVMENEKFFFLSLLEIEGKLLVFFNSFFFMSHFGDKYHYEKRNLFCVCRCVLWCFS